MKYLFLFALLVPIGSPIQSNPVVQQESSVLVTAFKWFRSKQTVEKLDHAGSSTAATMLKPERNFERNTRINEPRGARDPRADTTDGRAEALEAIVQESRTPSSKPVEGFAYRAKIKNNGTKTIEVIFWEYKSIDKSDSSKISRRQFLCSVKVKPGKGTELKAFSLLSPSDAISVEALGKADADAFVEKALINRVEYADGSIWQRKDWNFSEIREGYERAVGVIWGSEMCRGI